MSSLAPACREYTGGPAPGSVTAEAARRCSSQASSSPKACSTAVAQRRASRALQRGVFRRGCRPRARGRAAAASRSRARRASLRSGTPAWRAPITWPSPRISRSRSASSKPSLVSSSAASRACDAPVSRLREEQAVRLRRPPAHPAAQLVQLGEPEAFGALDQHDGGVRHVDADLDEARGDEHVQPAGLEGRHDGIALGRLELPVHHADAELAELAAAAGARPRPRPWPPRSTPTRRSPGRRRTPGAPCAAGAARSRSPPPLRSRRRAE